MTPEFESEGALGAEVLSVERLVPGGAGLGRTERGRVVLVPGALPGDRVSVTEMESKTGALRATTWELVSGSADRVEPICEVAAACGGCDLMALSATAQQEAKRRLLEDALTRVAHLEPAKARVPLTTAGPPLGYRNRLRLQIGERARIGFFQKQSRSLVEAKRCHVARPEIEEALKRLRKHARRDPHAFEPFASVEVRVCEGAVGLYFALAPGVGWLPAQSAGLLTKLRQDYQVATSLDRAPAPLERHRLCGDTYLYASPGSFTQVNWPVNRALIERLLQQVASHHVADFIDLYCGSGNFALTLLAAGLRGVGVESDRGAIRAARLAAREQELRGRFVAEDAVAYATRAAREGRLFDLVVCDPPRAGVKQGLGAIASIARSHVALVSCDPGTFARDLRGLIDSGFELSYLEAFDMFPQTHHLEAFAWLTRQR